VWEANERIYVPSMLVHEGRLYGVLDSGVAVCWESATGKELWKARLGGNFSGSPVLADGKIYVGSESGTLSVFKASPAGLEVLAENVLGGEIYSTPSICGGEIFLRVASYQGEKRTETLYCFGE
jgi:outer membrane protein assembly factor BamB